MKFIGTAAIVGLALCCALAGAAMAQSPPLEGWDGTQWKALTQEMKVAYVKGIGEMASFEVASGGASRAACISKGFVDELKTKSLGQVVTEVGTFYQQNPGKLKTPVVAVILMKCTKLCSPEPISKEVKK
ncbi:MAG: hypothetical protein NTW80_04570 [Deltaproteobacteria bacterium]|nr:hypothetical protein [Deltaproteobacteria bacterium]